MSDPRIAKSLDVLRSQMNATFPGRNKANDGWIGDPRHQAGKSEHNPDRSGVVRALDITNDPAVGLLSDKIAHSLVESRDARILYVISNARISNSTVQDWAWRPYSGSNPHDHHFHISVVATPALYDSVTPWVFDGKRQTIAGPVQNRHPTLRRGTSGADVKYLQRMLGLPDTGEFDSRTEQAVIDFQRKYGLVPDGVVGIYTWTVLEK